MNIARNLERAARHFPDRTALIYKDRRWSYRELDRAASSLAAGLKAFVVLKDGQSVDAATLQAVRREKIASHKVPEAVEFIAGLRKNPTGKILKKELRRPLTLPSSPGEREGRLG
jgi:acyl-CoA synthetase (AMP-forming)/AMP-acid ligase II